MNYLPAFIQSCDQEGQAITMSLTKSRPVLNCYLIDLNFSFRYFLHRRLLLSFEHLIIFDQLS